MLDVVDVVHIEEVSSNKFVEPEKVCGFGWFGHSRSLAPRAGLALKVLCNLDHISAGSSQSQVPGHVGTGRVSQILMKPAKCRGDVRGSPSKKVNAAGPKSVFVRRGVSISGIGHKDLIGEYGGDAEVLIPIFGVVSRV